MELIPKLFYQETNVPLLLPIYGLYLLLSGSIYRVNKNLHRHSPFLPSLGQTGY